MKSKVNYMMALAVGLIAACQPPVMEQQITAPILTEQQEILKGKKLVTTIGCGDCHSPKVFTAFGPEEDNTRLLSGHPQNEPLPAVNKELVSEWVLFGHQSTVAVGPWGVSYAANISSDETGIGNWTFEQFKTAMTKGKYKGVEASRDLLPPMPWPNYAQLEEDELRAIFKYLKSTPPVRNIVPGARPLETL